MKEGFSQLALSEGLQFGHAKAIMYRNKQTNEFIIDVDNEIIGPFKRNQLEVLDHILRDTLELVK